MIFVDALSFAAPKAADAKNIVKALAKGADKATLATKRVNAALIVIPKRDANVELSFRNFGNYEVAVAKDINPIDLLTYKYVVVADPKTTVEALEARVVRKTAKAA
jgi:ribosomal protein L4